MKKIISTAAVLLTAAGLHAQIVTNMGEGVGGVVTTTNNGALTGEEYAAPGIIEDWDQVLEDFNHYEDRNEVENKFNKLDKGEKKETVTVKGVKLNIPEVIDENGIDLFMLTEEGIKLYMMMDPPAYVQDVDRDIIKWIRYYAYQKRAYTFNIFQRFDKWEKKIHEEFEKYSIPPEMAELCLIESGCNYSAKSSAGAVGMWQIMPATGRQYGMIISQLSDERTDPEKALTVAARIIRDCYKKTRNWTLAAAAYNCGSAKITKQKAAGRNTWQEMKYNLPKETQQYIPSLIAMHYVWKYRVKLAL